MTATTAVCRPSDQTARKSGGQKPSSGGLQAHLATQLLIFCSSLPSLLAADRHEARNVLFLRNIWVPQLVVSLILLLTGIFSSASASLRNSSIVFADTFCVIMLEKLVVIGYNLHLIVFHAKLLYSSESALLLLPLMVFLVSVLESGVVVAYLDTVYWDIHEWQRVLTERCHIRLLSSLLPHHLLCVFLFKQFDNISVHFNQYAYTLMDI